VAVSVLLLLVALAVSVLSTRLILEARLDERLTREIDRDTQEFTALAGGVDPATGAPFGQDVERIFRVFLQRNVPSRNEVFLTYVDGEPFLRSGGLPPARLDQRAELTRRWGRVTAVEQGRLQVEGAGDVLYRATPVRAEGALVGVFVTAWFRDLEVVEIGQVVTAASVLGGLVLLFAAAVVWNVTGRVLRPVDEVAATARTITDTDLSRRITAHRGSDEIGRLVATFNDMLDRLETAFRAQREFIDDAGHELRTPVTIIRGNLDLLDHGDAAQRTATLALVNDELDRMQRMVDDLLLLAKAQRPDFVDLAPVDLDELTEEALTKARALGDRRWELAAAAPGVVDGDRHRLTQALLQLAQNAVQHTAEGDRIAIGSALRDGRAHLWVVDDGPGVDPAQAQRIFARFGRGTDTPARHDGAGLGLAIVDAIARAHGGHVATDRPQGGGARFTIMFPAEQATGQTQATDEHEVHR
jgi:signal transduction histidine kinase